MRKLKHLMYFESKIFKEGEMVKIGKKTGRVLSKINDGKYVVSVFGGEAIELQSDEISKIIRCKAICDKQKTEDGIVCFGCGKKWG